MRTPRPPPSAIILSTPSPTESSSKYLVYFLPGNPGLVNFYREFLEHLHLELSNSPVDAIQECGIDILGTSLAGFDSELHPRVTLPLDLDGQTRFAEEILHSYMSSTPKREKCSVILVGHSLGAFLSLQIVQRLQRERSNNVKVVGTIGLFPGVVDLTDSIAARRVSWLTSRPWLLAFIRTCLIFVILWLPFRLLLLLVSYLTGYPDDHVAAICHWLRSKWGLYESLYLGLEELERISADCWDDNVWGPSVYLLFGEHDDWISSTSRDNLVRSRGRMGTDIAAERQQPIMEIERTGIPHDFAIRHSKPVAVQAARWIEEIIRADKRAR